MLHPSLGYTLLYMGFFFLNASLLRPLAIHLLHCLVPMFLSSTVFGTVGTLQIELIAGESLCSRPHSLSQVFAFELIQSVMEQRST